MKKGMKKAMRKNGNIRQYEKEILELKKQGFTKRAIAEKLGLEKSQIDGFICRYNEKQRKIERGEKIRKQGRPRKEDREPPRGLVDELQRKLEESEKRLKYLEMENKLMKDFLELTERK